MNWYWLSRMFGISGPKPVQTYSTAGIKNESKWFNCAWCENRMEGKQIEPKEMKRNIAQLESISEYDRTSFMSWGEKGKLVIKPSVICRMTHHVTSRDYKLGKRVEGEVWINSYARVTGSWQDCLVFYPRAQSSASTGKTTPPLLSQWIRRPFTSNVSRLNLKWWVTLIYSATEMMRIQRITVTTDEMWCCYGAVR